jgi:hypothetical protein
MQPRRALAAARRAVAAAAAPARAMTVLSSFAYNKPAEDTFVRRSEGRPAAFLAEELAL